MFFKSNFIKTNGTTKRGRKIYVETPRGRIVEVRHKDGKVSMKLQWADSFSKKQNQNFRNAQAFIDSECIRLMVKYTPARNNILYKSATLGTQIGSGEIHQVAPYARYLYYGEIYGPNIPIYEQGQLVGFYSPPSKSPTGREMQYDTARHPQAQKLWFEVMKTNHKQQILRGAAAIASRKR